MRVTALAAIVVLSGCGLGMMGRGAELEAPTVGALTQAADGTEHVPLTWSEPSVTQDFLAGVTAASSGDWLAGTAAPGDRELELVFRPGFSRAMAGQGPYTVTLTLPDRRRGGHSCACCQHEAHAVTVALSFDAQGAMAAPQVTQLVR